MEKPTDSKLTFIKFARVLTYLVYAYAIIATVFLIFGFFFMLFGANSHTPFVNFVYNISAQFLKPFRDIFPGQQISDTSYFDAAALFAIIFYGIFAMAIHSLITYITVKQVRHQKELIEIENYNRAKAQRQAAQVKRPTTAPPTKRVAS